MVADAFIAPLPQHQSITLFQEVVAVITHGITL
jgi:hypothetical protein